MSVVAYGSLVSLLQVLDQIQKHYAWGRIRLDIQQVQNFKDSIQFLQRFLEIHSQKLSKEDIESLAPGITDVAREAEIIIDRNVVDQLRGMYDDENDKGISAFRVALEDVVQVMDSIKKGLTNKLQVVQRKRSLLSIHSDPVHSVPAVTMSTGASSTIKSSETSSRMVGSENLINQIVDKLTNDEKSLQVISIVGMGGIGKTTLAKCIFQDSRIVNRFDRLKWCTISQQYDEHEVIRGLLDENSNKRELGVQLHQELNSRRYLIVVDDIWNIEVLDKLKLFFPDNSNGSRLIVTTRLFNVVEYLGSQHSYQLDFLTDVESWDLLCEKTFGQQSCPTSLEKFGKKIARSCTGLPISIVTIAGLLSKSDMTPEYWEFVAKNAKRITSSGDDERCLKILYLSYDNLPIHLKLCFIDFANHREDEYIQASELIRNWVYLGMIQSVPGQRIEDIANGYLNELTERNLIFIRVRKFSGKIKYYGMHDLLRELCIKESQEEKLIHNSRSQILEREILLFGKRIARSNDQSFMCIFGKNIARCCIFFKKGKCFICDASKCVDFMEMVPVSRSTLYAAGASFCGRCKMEHSHLLRSRWVTLLEDDTWNTQFTYPTQLRIVHRSDAFITFRWPSPILFLWNLQTIYTPRNRTTGLDTLPIEIWEMPQLRHLIVPSFVLPAPVVGEGGFTVLEELQTVEAYRLILSRATIERMPNIRKLKINYKYKAVVNSRCGLENVSFFTKLESLTLDHMESIIFPHSLKKLHLMRCRLCHEDMDAIGSLSDLQVLNLQNCKFEDNMWSPTEGKFLQLKVLKIERSNLCFWEAEQDHFPKLERLCLEEFSMDEIPSDIANIPTLLSIDLIGCSEAVIESAKKILEEQQSLGNEGPKLFCHKKVRL